jgi:hypothetical protein
LALLGRGIRSKEEDEAFLALVLEKLAKRESAPLAHSVQLGLTVHLRSDACREQ